MDKENVLANARREVPIMKKRRDQITIYMDEKFKSEFKSFCKDNDLVVSKVIQILVRDFMDKVKGENK